MKSYNPQTLTLARHLRGYQLSWSLRSPNTAALRDTAVYNVNQLFVRTSLIAVVAITAVSYSIPTCDAQVKEANPETAGKVQAVINVDQAVVTLLEQVLVPAEEAGVVKELAFQEGEQVKKGQLLARLNDDSFQVQVTVAESEVLAAQLAADNSVEIEYAIKSAEVARKTWERSVQANQRAGRAVSKTEIERLDLEYQRARLSQKRAERDQRIAESQAEISKQQLALAKIRLKQRHIVSPIDGHVIEKLFSEGEWVNSGQPLMRVICLDRLKVQFFLDKNLYDSSLLNRPVEFNVSLPPDAKQQTFSGVVRFVSPEVILNRDQFSLWAEIDNSDLLLRPGLSGKLKLLAK